VTYPRIKSFVCGVFSPFWREMKLVCSMIWEAKAIHKTNKKAGKV